MRVTPFCTAVGSLLLLTCSPPPSSGPAPSSTQSYVVRVSSGDLEDVPVDWAILPDEGWPVEGRRDRTPFTTELPTGQVAAVFRAKSHTVMLDLTLLRRLPDGTLQRIATASGLPLGAVLVDPSSGRAEILTTRGNGSHRGKALVALRIKLRPTGSNRSGGLPPPRSPPSCQTLEGDRHGRRTTCRHHGLPPLLRSSRPDSGRHRERPLPVPRLRKAVRHRLEQRPAEKPGWPPTPAEQALMDQLRAQRQGPAGAQPPRVVPPRDN